MLSDTQFRPRTSRQEMSVENVSTALVPQGQKSIRFMNSDPVPPSQNVVLQQMSQIRPELESSLPPIQYQTISEEDVNRLTSAVSGDRYESKFLLERNPIWLRKGVHCKSLEVVEACFNPIKLPEKNPFLKDKLMSDPHQFQDSATQRQEVSVEDVSSGLVPQGPKGYMSDYDTLTRAPKTYCCSFSREDRFGMSKG
ncbi:hypothetical protein Tco_0525417 [Tanacetum coccineum]